MEAEEDERNVDMEEARRLIKAQDSIQNHCINSYFSTDPSMKTKLYVEASPVGLGDILAQETEASELQIIAPAIAREMASPEEKMTEEHV